MLNIDKVIIEGSESMWIILDPGVHNHIYFVKDMPEQTIFNVNLKDEEDNDDLNEDDDYYNEDNEEKESPFDREPADNEIRDEDFPLGTPEDDLTDDDEEIPYN